MKNVDIEAIQKRRYETYELEKSNLIAIKVDGGYEVTNVNKASRYSVTKDKDSGEIQCTCKDYAKFGSLGIRCKHIITVIKRFSKAANSQVQVIKTEDHINKNKEEENNMNNQQNNPANNPIIPVQENTDIQVILARPFLSEQIRYREGQKKKQLAYVETVNYIDRLNEAFSHQWNWEIMSEIITEHEVYCRGKLTIKIAGEVVVKEAYGGKDLTVIDVWDKQTGKVIGRKPFSIADDLKSASSDALKKACSLLGIGAHLYKSGNNISSATSTTSSKTAPSIGKPSASAGPSVTPAVPTAKPQTSASIPTQKQPSTVSKSSGGNGKNGNNSGGNGKTDINSIIKRW